MKSVFAPFVSFAVSFAAATSLILSAGSAGAELAPEYKFLEEKFPDTPIDSVKDAPIPGFLEMTIGADIFYVSADGKYLVQGEIYDIDTKLNLTENAKAESRRAYATRFGDGESVLFAAPDPVAEVVVFTDIDCGYCRKLHREMPDYHAKGISIRYVFFPRSGPGSSSWAKAEAVMCSESQQGAMTRAKNNEPVEAEPCDEAAVIGDHYVVVNELGLRGTPALLTQKGTLIVGYRSADELLAVINDES